MADPLSASEPIMSYLFPLFAILFWAGNVIVSKMAASAISPTAITFYRLILALAIMGVFTAAPAWRWWAMRHIACIRWRARA